MSLEKAILHKKEHRKQYTGGKTIDKSCRNHGSCTWCLENRMHKYRVRKEAAKEQEKEYYEGE